MSTKPKRTPTPTPADSPLTDAEQDALEALGWAPAGGGKADDGTIYIRAQAPDGTRREATRAVWRTIIAAGTCAPGFDPSAVAPEPEPVIVQASLFDYTALDTEARIVVQQRTSEIKTLMRRAAQDIVEIGERLIEVKARLPHGQFGVWLKAEFEWSDRTAQNFMQVAARFKSATVADFSARALYLLAAPSTPDEARDQALARAEAGEAITHKTVKAIIEEVRQPPPAPAVLDEADDGEPLTSYEASVASRFVDPPLTEEELSGLSELGDWELTRIEPDGTVWLRLCQGEEWGQEESRSPGGWRYELGVLRDERAQWLAKQAERIAVVKAEAEATLRRKRGEPEPRTLDESRWQATAAAAPPAPATPSVTDMMAMLQLIAGRLDAGCAGSGDRQELERLAFRAAQQDLAFVEAFATSLLEHYDEAACEVEVEVPFTPLPVAAVTSITYASDVPDDGHTVEDDDGRAIIWLDTAGIDALGVQALLAATSALRLLLQGNAHEVDTVALDGLVELLEQRDGPATGTLLSVLSEISGDADALCSTQYQRRAG
jgi:hypothetical protein